MRCWLDLDLGSEVMASGFLSCFMIMVTNYFEILQEEKWLGYGPSYSVLKMEKWCRKKILESLIFLVKEKSLNDDVLLYCTTSQTD